MNPSPFAWCVLTVGVLALYITAAVLAHYGHISDRTAAAAYLTTTMGVVAITGAAASWWSFAPAILSAAFFAGLLASTWKDTP